MVLDIPLVVSSSTAAVKSSALKGFLLGLHGTADTLAKSLDF